MSDPKYINFGPVVNPDGTPTEFTKGMFGVKDDPVEEEPFAEIKRQLKNLNWELMDAVPDKEGFYIMIVVNRTTGRFSTHATEWGNRGLCWGHYDFTTYEDARHDALLRALKSCSTLEPEYRKGEG